MTPTELKVKLSEVVNEFNKTNKCVITKIDIEARVINSGAFGDIPTIYQSVIEIG